MSFFFAEHMLKSDGLPTDTLNRMGCLACPLNETKHQNTHKMEPGGSEQAEFYFLGGNPSLLSDRAGEPFEDTTGGVLKDLIPPSYLSKIRWGYVIQDLPISTKNIARDPTRTEIECCRKRVEADIEAVKPKIIIGTDEVAMEWVIGETGKFNLTKNRGRYFPVRIGKHECWFTVIYFDIEANPKYARIYDEILSDDMSKVFDESDTMSNCRLKTPWLPMKETIYEDLTLESKSVHKIEEFLTNLYCQMNPIAFDIETRGLRPYKGGEILTIAIGNKFKTIAFPLDHPKATWTQKEREKIFHLIKAFLVNPTLEKVAQNLSFELEWCGYVFGKEIFKYRDTFHCTMAQAYNLDERKMAKSLDYLTLLYFGFNLKSETTLDKTRLAEIDVDRVLKYNALDTKWTALLYNEQDNRLKDEGLIETYNYHRRRIPTLVLSQLKGLSVNDDLIKEYDTKLEKQQAEALEKLHALEDVIEYERRTRKEFDPLKTTHIVIPFFRDFIGSKQGVSFKTKTGYSVDKHILKQIKHPAAKHILDFRTANKLRSTYVMPYLEEYRHDVKNYWLQPDGRIYTNFNHSFTETGRLSSSGPNIQNFPREQIWIRNFVIPKSNYIFMKNDYGQIEARIIAMVSEDKFLMEALWTNYDIHMEWAELYVRRWPHLTDHKFDKKAMKDFRSIIKNTMVFPAFYGSTAKSIAESLLLPKEDVEPILAEFWDKYAGVRIWQKKMLAFYDEYGYVESLFGRRYRAPLTKNEVLNYLIQGPASDLVVDAQCRLSEKAIQEDKPHLQANISLHDDLTFEILKKLFEQEGTVIVEEMLNVDSYDWINVPLSVEVSTGPSWGEQEEFGTFYSHEIGET